MGPPYPNRQRRAQRWQKVFADILFAVRAILRRASRKLLTWTRISDPWSGIISFKESDASRCVAFDWLNELPCGEQVAPPDEKLK
jgi:hypothetical protein